MTMHRDDARAHYDAQMPQKFGDDYEYRRWHETPIKEAGYQATRAAIERHVLSAADIRPKRVLEIGPGAGTWSKLLLERYPDASFDLVDISEQMIARSRAALGSPANVTYHLCDIFEYDAPPYDLLFSSRMLEYVPEKAEFAERLAGLLAPGAQGFLITKMPHYRRAALTGRQFSAFHQGQIAPEELAKHLTRAGLEIVGIYPVTVSVPGVPIAALNAAVAKQVSGSMLGPISGSLAESYAIKVAKPLRA